MNYENGDKYEGEWKNDMKNGKGKERSNHRNNDLC